jgi:hypothetical protein
MIDNVHIGSNNPSSFTKAVRNFLRRCRLFGCTLNDVDKIPSSDAELLRQADTHSAGHQETFLGEVYSGGLVRNTDRNVEKLAMSLALVTRALQDPDTPYTRRNLAAIIGLANWLNGTFEISVRTHFGMLRTFARLEQSPARWDEPIKVTPELVNTLQRVTAPLLENKPVIPRAYPMPPLSSEHYEAAAIVDASATGWGAYVRIGRTIFELRCGWRTHIRHSAWAEPIAAKEVVDWLKPRTTGNIALITDHLAIPSGQRRPRSGNGGFSKSYHLNNFYCSFYGDDNRDNQAFFVDGKLNLSDGISRENEIGQPLRVREISNMTFPSLKDFSHPYAKLEERLWWNV